VSDEPSNGELGRLIQALRSDMREDLQQLQVRLDKQVPMDVYTIEKQALADRVAALETRREQEQRERRQDRRLIVSAFVAPILMLVIQLVIAARGAGA
jgi:hypothetical protein